MSKYNELLLTSICSDWRKGTDYLAQKGYYSQINENYDFVEDRQWSLPTQRTRSFPRPVLNAISMILDNKVSNVLGSPIKLNYLADSNNEATEIFTNFADYIQKELEQEHLNNVACRMAAIEGCAIYHYYYDETARGTKGRYEGGVRGEIIDNFNIVFADEKETDVQKQKYYIIRTRMDIDIVRKMCESKKEREKVVADDENDETPAVYYGNNIEQDSVKQCYVYTRVFRKNGEVYFEKATKTAIIHKPRPYNPSKILKQLEAKQEPKEIQNEKTLNNNEEQNIEEMDNQIPKTHDSNLEESESVDTYKAYLYPIEVFRWKEKKNSIRGRSEVEGLIPNQKAINLQIAMTLMSSMANGAPKILVKPGALQGQVITNDPMQVLTDYSPDGRGISALQVQPFSAGLMSIAPTLLDLTRIVSNATEVITGEMLSKDMSGTAIAQLQAQATKPIANIQKNFWRSQERIGKILEQYFKLFYEEKEFSYNLPEDKYQEERKLDPQASRQKKGIFFGNEFQNTNFNIVVEAGAGTQYSEIASMQMLDTLLQQKLINFEQYVELYPKTAMPFKADLRAIIRKQQESENAILKQQLVVLQQQLQQAGVVIKQQDYELKKTQTYSDNLVKEFEKQFNALKLANSQSKITTSDNNKPIENKAV